MQLRKVAKIDRRLYGGEEAGASFYPHHTNVSKVGKNREIRSLFLRDSQGGIKLSQILFFKLLQCSVKGAIIKDHIFICRGKTN